MSDNQEAIRSALAKLEQKNDDHWTETNLPRLEALGLKGVSRQEVTAAAPLFNRTAMTLETAPEPIKEVKTLTITRPDYEALHKVAIENSAEAEARLAQARDMLKEVQAEVELLAHKRDVALKRLEEAQKGSGDLNMQGIKAVLNRNLESRKEAADIAKQLKDAGITQRLLQKGSPLDQAMARKRGLGLNRPTIPTGR